MAATWPDTLPQLLQVAGNSEGIPDGRLKSPTSTGPGKMRPLSSALGRPLAGTMRMSAAQLDILADFVAATLATGTLPFYFPVTRGAGTWLVRFSGQLPSWSNIGGDNWTVQLMLEILP